MSCSGVGKVGSSNFDPDGVVGWRSDGLAFVFLPRDLGQQRLCLGVIAATPGVYEVRDDHLHVVGGLVLRRRTIDRHRGRRLALAAVFGTAAAAEPKWPGQSIQVFSKSSTLAPPGT